MATYIVTIQEQIGERESTRRELVDADSSASPSDEAMQALAELAGVNSVEELTVFDDTGIDGCDWGMHTAYWIGDNAYWVSGVATIDDKDLKTFCKYWKE